MKTSGLAYPQAANVNEVSPIANSSKLFNQMYKEF